MTDTETSSPAEGPVGRQFWISLNSDVKISECAHSGYIAPQPTALGLVYVVLH